MVRVFLFFFIIFSCLRGDLLEEKIKNYISNNNFEKHSRLIKKIFREKDVFYNENKLDCIKIISTLKKNGLLELFFQAPARNIITFKVKGSLILFMRIVEEVLTDMGYSYFLTESLEKNNDKQIWSITFVSEYTLDPEIFSKFLKKRECSILDIKREGLGKWVYEVDAREALLVNVKKIQISQSIRLKRGLDDYWLRVDNGERISIASYGGNRWRPYIVIYDRNLNILKIFKRKEKSSWVVVFLPKNSFYIKISDIFTLDNVKYGLKVSLE